MYPFPEPCWKSPFDEDAGWRETYLAQLGEPEQRRVLRDLSRLLITLVREAPGPATAAAPEPLAKVALAAAAADLRHLEGYLSAVADWPLSSAVEGRAELRLCALAGEQARSLSRLAGDLEAAIAPRPSR